MKSEFKSNIEEKPAGILRQFQNEFAFFVSWHDSFQVVLLELFEHAHVWNNPQQHPRVSEEAFNWSTRTKQHH